jgi:transposase
MITLTAEERKQIDDLIHRGMSKARVLTRARILLKSADGWSIERIAQALDVCPATVSNTRRRYQQGGVQRVLGDLSPKPREPALDAQGEAVLIATACSPVPEGHDHWTLRMLRGRLIELGVVEGISAATVHATLKKMRLSPGGGSTGASRSRMRRS